MKFKMLFCTILAFLCVSVPVFAGVMETVAGIAKSSGVVYAVVTAALLCLFRYIPNDKIQLIVGKFAYGLGVTITLGLAKWKFTAPIWNKTVEPWVVDLFDNTLVTFQKRFVDGLRSDKTNGG